MLKVIQLWVKIETVDLICIPFLSQFVNFTEKLNVSFEFSVAQKQSKE